MRPAGLAEVERAKADGRWAAAYDGSATAVVPDDLAAALAARGLTDVYAALDSRNRFAFLNRIQTAVRPETRIRRIEQLTDALAQGKTPTPPRGRSPVPSGCSAQLSKPSCVSARRCGSGAAATWSRRHSAIRRSSMKHVSISATASGSGSRCSAMVSPVPTLMVRSPDTASSAANARSSVTSSPM